MGESLSFMPEEEQKESKPRLSELLQKYMGGDGHIHSVFSNPSTRHEADYSFDQIYKFTKDELNKQGGTEFMILAEHPSDAGNPQRVSGESLLEHQQAIDRLNQERDEQDPKLLCAVEADIISPQGEVNVPNKVLSQIDLVLGSKHDLRQVFPESNGQPDARQLTDMYLGLMDNPHIDVIAHPNRYVPYETLQQMDWGAIFQKARETKTALEINLNASLTEELIKMAVAHGVPLIIGTDAHALSQYQQLSEEAKKSIEEAEDPATERLKYPLGVKYSFWKRVSKILRVLDEASTPSEQIITSSRKNLEKWLFKEKSEREINW